MASSGNFATWNRLVYSTNFRSGMSPSYGNTRSNPGNACIGFSTMAMTTGKKWYIEAYAILAYNLGTIGIFSLDSYATKNNFNANYHNSDGIFWHSNGQLYIESDISQSTTAYNSGDVVAFAVDLESTTETVKFYKNGSLQDTQNIPSGFLNRDWFFSLSRPTSGGGYIMNAGQDSTFAGTISAGGNSDDNGFGDFKYSVPSGYLALCSGNLGISDDIDPAQTDDDIPSKQFNVATWTGNGTNDTAISLGMQPDLVVIKERGSANNWYWIDSTRGVSNTLQSNTNAGTHVESGVLNAFTSTGFTIGTSGGSNNSSDTYCGWGWRANGGTTTSDSSGDITVTRQTNDVAKFSILTYTGNGSSGSTIAHGLGVKPAMTIIKQRNSSNGWNVWHQGNNNGDYDSFGELNSNASWYQNQGSNGPYTTDPTTSLLTLTAYGQVNGSSNTYLAYVWADVEGMQKFGNYEGNGNADGVFVYTGFRPRMIFLKRTDSSGSWHVFDSARNTFNALDIYLLWNGTGGDDGPYDSNSIDFLSNGFKIRNNGAGLNASSGDYIYGAWGDVSFKYNNTF